MVSPNACSYRGFGFVVVISSQGRGLVCPYLSLEHDWEFALLLHLESSAETPAEGGGPLYSWLEGQTCKT